MSKIDPSLFLSQQSNVRKPSAELGKNEFLQLLMTQLQNQDPLNPMDDREFISQMATFSSLEQTMKIANSVDALVHSQLISPVIKYSHMIGKKVAYPSEGESEENNMVKTSRVIAVSQKDGWAILELENGEEVYADAILQVKDIAK